MRMKIRQRMRNITAGLLTAALCLGLCACKDRTGPAEEPEPVTFRLGYSQSPVSLNPYGAVSDLDASVLALLYDTLFVMDIETGKYINSLCLDYTVTANADDSFSWHMEIRSGVTWHDGQPLTAEDVAFSLMSCQQFSNLYSYPECEFIHPGGITVTDDTHLSMVVWGDYPYIEECLSKVPILPEHIWNALPYMQYGSDGWPADIAAAREELYQVPANADTMIGSGIYEWVGSTETGCQLRRNDEYWNGTAAAERVELVYGVTDPVQALEEGSIDACWDMPAADYAALGEGAGLWTADGSAGELITLDFNLHDDPVSTGNPLLLDRMVRQALEECVPREEIFLTAFGSGIASSVPLEEGGVWYYGAETLSGVRSFDTASAAARLENAGYRDTDGDGIRESGDGTPLAFTLLCSVSDPAWSAAANLIQEACLSAGIQLQVTALPPEELYGRMDAYDYDMALTIRRTYSDPFFALGRFYWNGGLNAYSLLEDGVPVSYPGWNESGYANETYDRLYQDMVGEKDAAVRARLVHELGQILMDDVPSVVLGFTQGRQACSAAWTGLRRHWGTGLFFLPETIRQQLQGMSLAGEAAE